MDTLASESRRGFAALLLRGGRLTKLAGEVASFAPALGGAAVALLSSLSVPVAGILSGAFLGLTAQHAMACGFTGEKWTCGNRTSTLTDSAPRAGLLVDDLRVEVVSNATINVSSGLAFDLTHTGSGGIHWEHIGRAIIGSPHKEVTGGTGVIEATNSGGGNIRIIAKATLKATVNTTTVASTTVPVVKVVNSGNGHIDLDFTAVTSSRRNGHAIWVENDGSGKTDITATGAITAGTGWGYGLYARGGANGNANTSLNISVASVTGFQRGMYIKHKGRGNVSISATGAVTSAGTAAGDSNSGNDAIRVINDDHASDIKVTAATVTARGTGGGDNGIYVHQQHGGTVEISASGPVTTGGGHGIFVKQDGNDAVTINVTGSVTGDDDDNESAIKVEAGANDAVTVNLNSGAVVGSANEDAVVETGGNATVSVKSGAEVKGAIKLGGGNDKVILSGGTAGGSIDFGAGIDTLEVSTSGALSMPTASNFETLALKDNVDVSSAIAISRSGSDALNVTLASGTDVSVNQGAAFTLNRTSGSGNIIFTQAEGGQRLTGRQGVINVTNSGSGNIWITATGQLRLDNRLRTGSAVKAFNENTSGGFIVVSVNSIDITEAGRNSNAIEVKNEGTGPIIITATGHLQPVTLGGHGIYVRAGTANTATTASLNIDVAQVTASWMGMRIRHKGGGDVFISATGAVTSTIRRPNGFAAAIDLVNYTGASSITISVATVTGNDGKARGIRVEQRASGSVTIGATGPVRQTGGTNESHAIQVKSLNTGDVIIRASDTVTAENGGNGIHIFDEEKDAGDVTITTATVTGAGNGIRVIHKRGGDVSVTATGAVTGKGQDESDKGIWVANERRSSDIFIAAASVTAEGTSAADGIYVDQRHGGDVRISASGSVTTTGRHGIYLKQAGNGDTTITVTGTVTGDDDDGDSAIKVSAGSGDNVNILLNSGAVVGSANEDAIVETGGDTTLTVNSGAEVKGEIKLGAGADEVVLAGGTLSGDIDFGAGKDTLTINAEVDRPDATGVEILGFDANAVIDEAVTLSHSAPDNIGIKLSHMTTFSGVTGTVFTLTQSGAGGVEFMQQTSGQQTISGETGVIKATNEGEGDIEITATRTIELSSSGTGVYAKNSDAAGDDVTIDLGTVTVTDGHGVHVVQDGSGTVDIDVSGAIAGAGGNNAAIRVEAGSGDDVEFNLESGAVVGAANRNAVVETGGNAILTVESGATVRGTVNLGGGDGDELVVNGTAMLDGLMNVETIKVGATGSAKIEGAFGASALEVASGGTLSVQDGTIRTHNVSGNLTGGGTIKVDIDATNKTADKFIVTGAVSGTTKIDVMITHGTGGSFEVFEVSGNLTDSAFIAVDDARYILQRGTGGGANANKFYVVTSDDCAETSQGSGIYTCSGQIVFNQPLSASGTTSLSVTLHDDTTVNVGNVSAFSLTQTGGTGGIAFTQSANGRSVSGAQGGIVASNSGGGAISINVNGSVTGTAGNGIGATNDASGGGITITAGSVYGAESGIRAVEGGAGAVNIVATGSVAGTGTNGVGINALASSAGALTVAAATVTGSAVGIRAVSSGTGAVSIQATGSVEATGATSGIGIDAKTSSGGALTITAAAVTGSAFGIRAISSGTGAMSVQVGAVEATGTSGVGIYAKTSGGALTITAAAVTGTSTGIKAMATGTGGVSISASGAVTGTGSDGIFVDHDGSGATTITVTTAVTGGTGANVAAIRTDAQSNSTVTILLNSGAMVGTTAGTPNAIMGGAGNTTVTVNSGASIAGKVKLGDGTDTLTFVDGTFSDVTEFDGGGGSGDTLTFRSGSGSLHTTVQADGLKGWESVVVESGATITGSITLDDTSKDLTIHGASPSTIDDLHGGDNSSGNTLTLVDFNSNQKTEYSTISGSVNDFETFGIGDGTTISFGSDSHTHAGGLIVASGGTLDVGDDADTDDALTVTGAFEGGGRITLDVKFDDDGSDDGDELDVTNDSLMIGGNVASGSVTTIHVSRIPGVTLTDKAPRRIDLVNVTGTVTESAFALYRSIGGAADLYGYTLDFDSTDKKFYLKRLSNSGCRPGTGAGVFTCEGAADIELSQTLSASGAVALAVTLNAQTGVKIDGQATAFILTQSDGTGGISFTQSAGGQSISAAASGIVASNSGGGAIQINVNGSVTVDSGQGIKATDDASGGGITITAASVTGSAAGIFADSSAGAVSVAATGEVKGTGASGQGIFARALEAGSVTLNVATVAGGAAGIKVEGVGTGNVTVEATGNVTATGTNGIGIDAQAAGGDVTVSAAGVTGTAAGIRAVASGAGSVSISASGRVVGSGTSGIYASDSASGTGIAITAASVMGSSVGIRAVSMGTGAVSISASGRVVGSGTNGIYASDSASGTGITISAGTVTGSSAGIRAVSSGTGAVSIAATGAVTGTGANGIGIDVSASGGITISAGTVTGGSAGIRAVSSGTGAVSIAATGAVTGTGANGVGIDVSASGGITISAGTVTGGSAGIRAVSSGTGAVSIAATGAVTGTGNSGIGIDVSSSGGNVTISAAGVTGTATGIKIDASGAGDVSISATGEVKGTGSDGIFVDLDGSGTTAIAVSSTVTGGTGASVAAIRTNVSSGSDVTVTLNSGASVGTTGSPNAIMDSAGSATVTVNTGASIIGSVTLGAGDDALTFAGGAFSEVTEFSGGAGADTLTFSGGSGSLHATVVSEGLKGWESIVIESGATISGGITLAADSGNLTLDGVDISSIGTLTGGAGSANTLALESVSGTLGDSSLSGWETVRIDDGSTISFGSGSHTLDSGLIVAEGGTLNLRTVSGTDEHLEVSGNFAGGGTVALNVSASATMADMLTISGDVSGATTLDVRGIVMDEVDRIAGTGNDTRELKLITVHGSVNAGAFALAAGFGSDSDPYRFTLSFRESEKEFFLRRLSSSECKAGAVTGAFSCEGRAPIELGQSLSASGTADLVVTLDSQTEVHVGASATALTLTQTGGTGGVSFTQSANGRSISAPLSGVVADNKAGGAILINVNGSVRGDGGDGIRALNDASGGGIRILAGSVTGSAAGIVAIGHGSGTVSVSAAGSVAAAAADGIGISATAGRAAAGLSIAAGSVSGGDVGIRAVGSGGAISVSATGAVAGTGTAGVQVDGRVDVTDVAVSVATVTGATGVHVRGDGSGSVSVTATGAVSGTGGGGYGIRVVAGERTSSVTVAAAGVEGSRVGIRVTASGGADVSVAATGSVEGGTHDGIYLDLDGRGETDVRVSGPVMGGGAPRTAAIRTVSQTGGSAVRITLASGASVGRKGRRAIMDTRGDATVTVNSGASVAGEVRLGAGADSLVFAGGAFSDVTVMDGGSGVDTLRFVRGSGTIDPSVSAAGFRGWESVIVESGAAISGSFTLAADSGDVTFRGADVGSLTALTTKAGSATLSFEGASGSIDGDSVSGWRSISISGGAKIGFGGDSATVSVKEKLRVGAGATLEVGGNGSAADTLTISGTFAGGGTATLDVDFANATSDKLVITGDATGRTNVLIGRVGPVPAPASLDDLSPIRNVITVRGTVGAGVAFGGFHELGAFGYQLRPSANGRNFDLIPVLANNCGSSPGAPGAFTCSGTNTIGVTQTLSASGATNLSVTLNSEARVEAGGAAFVLEQTGGGGSLSLTQSATGMEIGGGTSGIIARNDGGGTISIDVNGSVTAAGGDGIRAAGGSGGSGVAVVAAAVSGSRSGIVAIGSGAGEVAVRASGTVTGTSETGIHARSDGRASVSVGAVSVSGGRTGIHAVAGPAAGGLTVTAAAVSGGVTGIHAVASGTGAVSIMASGAVSGGSGDGILLERAAAGRAGISVSGPVGGGSGAGVAAIRTDAAGGSAISIAVNDGGAVGAAGQNAIIGGAGATEVTVNSGGSVAGSVDLGGGADAIVVMAGAGLSGEVTLGDGADEARLSLDADVSGLTRLDGGAGGGDTLRIDGGSGSLPEGGIGTGGLEGWESVVVESGASLSGRIRLAADSRNLTFDGARTRDVDFLTAGGASSVLAFNGVSDSLDANLEGWETVEIGGDSRVRFDAAQLRATAAKTLSVKGTLAFGDSRPGDAFTVDGDFAGGGSVAIDVNFAAGAGVGPTADRLVIGGDATGTTALAISDVTPAGAAVAGGDMDIVTVRGEADAASFTLDSDPVAYGAYIYDLKYVAGTAGRDSRFVLSPGDRVSDAGAVLKSAPEAIAAGLARAAGLAARTAARMPAAAVGAGLGMPATSRERGAAAAGQRAVDMAAAPARSLWARFVADSLKTDATGADGESEVSGSRFQIGADLLSGESAGGMWVAGLTVQYGSVSSEARGSGGTGRHEASGSGVGAAWTWFGTGGLYVDAQAQFGSFEADYTADTVGVIKKGVGGGTSLAALEVGRRFAAGDGMMVVPSGRLGRSSVATDKFTSEDGIEIDLGTASTTEVRLGIAAEFAFESGGARLSGSVSRSLGDPDGVVIAGQTVERDAPDGWVELGFGGSYDIDEGKALFLDGAWRTSLGDGAGSAGMSLSGGFRINW